MPAREAPCVELGSTPRLADVPHSPSHSISETSISSTSSLEPARPTPLFRALALPPPEPLQPAGQDELERRLPGYQRIVIPREATLIELLKQDSGVATDEEVLNIKEAKLRVVAERIGLRRLHVLAPRLRSLTLDGSALTSLRDLGIGLVHLKYRKTVLKEAKLRVVAERIGLRRLHVLAPRLRSLTLDGSALTSLRDLGIGLVHLKVLSVNRCGLSCLDGVWGLGNLQEFNAAGNRLRDLQPLGALSKLRTLNLANNPIEDSGRLWTLGVCGVLRHLTLQGTPVSDEPDYRARVASALPMLVTLDGRPLNEEEDSGRLWPLGVCGVLRHLTLQGTPVSDEPDYRAGVELALPMLVTLDGRPLNEEEEEDLDIDLPGASSNSASDTEDPSSSVFADQGDPPGPSYCEDYIEEELPLDKAALEDSDSSADLIAKLRPLRRRPATTENAGVRPERPRLPPRPNTAAARPAADAPSRLQFLNTLMDEEWRNSGSSLTSHNHGAVCGNIARALRRPTAARRYNPSDISKLEKELAEETLADATRAIAAEIPRAPRLEDWEKFRAETGIDIHIDFNQRPEGADPDVAIQRLEEIERETSERLSQESAAGPSTERREYNSPIGCHLTIMRDFENWKAINFPTFSEPACNVDDLFKNIGQ